MQTATIPYTLERDEPLDVELEFTFSPIIPATYDDPQEGGEIDAIQAYCGSTPIPLTDEELDDARDYIDSHFDWSAA